MLIVPCSHFWGKGQKRGLGLLDLTGELLRAARECPPAHCHCGCAAKESQRNPGAPRVSLPWAGSCSPSPMGSSPGMGWEGPRGDWDLWRIRGITQGLQGAAGTQGGQQVIRVREELYFFHVFPQEEKIPIGEAPSAAPSRWHSQV